MTQHEMKVTSNFTHRIEEVTPRIWQRLLKTNPHSQHALSYAALLVCAVLSLCLLNACRGASVQQSASTASSTGYQHDGATLPSSAHFVAKRSKGGTMRFDFEYIVARDTNVAAFPILFNATDCYVVLYDKALGVLDTIDVHLALGSTNESSDHDSIIVSSKGSWLNARSAEYGQLTFDIVISSQKKLYHDLHYVDLSPKDESEASGPLMKVIPDIDSQTDSSIVFGCAAQRMRGAYADYFPNSERLRLEILTLKGEVVYNSSVGKNFLQEVQPVEPKRKGDIIRYNILWNGKTNNGRELEAGTYVARLSLMAKPEAYVANNLSFEWKTKKP